jgi:glucose/arabinose dehydrogenase
MRPVLPTSIALAAAALAAAAPAPAQSYRPSGTCDGFPKLALKTAPGLCVGLVARRLGFPRGVAILGSDVYVTDLGARRPGRGRLLRLRNGGRSPPETLLSRLDQPSGLAPAPNGQLYLGEPARILRIDPNAPDIARSARVILDGLPGDGLHNLTAFAVAADGALHVNLGSATDNCENPDGSPQRIPCFEATARPPRGSILRVVPQVGRAVHARDAEVVARGLRNAMALAFTRQGDLVAATNARDAIHSVDPKLSDVNLPHDLLVRIVRGGDYGWPYCFDALRPSPEYPRFPCRTKRAPERLLPAHSAPLGALVYPGGGLPGPSDRLVLALHGYRRHGHRIVAFDLDAKGMTKAPMRDIVSGWNAAPGLRPRGAPTALAAAPDGSIYVVEDRNGTLLRIARARR